MREKNLHLVFAVDDIYAPASVVTARSARWGLRDRSCRLTFHVIDSGLGPTAGRDLLRSLRPLGDVEIYGVPGRLRLTRQRNYWTSAILGRIHVGSVIPADVDRVLYLDADTLVLEDPTPLYEQDLAGNTLGAVVSDKAPREWRGHPALAAHRPEYADDPPAYFNSGVLLIDMVKWRADQVTEKAIEMFHRYEPALRAPDQDLLNILFAGRYVALAEKWNKLIQTHRYGKFGEGRLDYLIRREGIIHYGGEVKPWHDEFPRNQLFDLYRTFSSQTPTRHQPADSASR